MFYRILPINGAQITILIAELLSIQENKMNTIVKKSMIHGLGVFATRNFKRGKVLENCRVIVIPKAQDKYIMHTIITNYAFEFGNDSALCLGNGRLYNHSVSPNADIVERERSISIVANKNIKAGEEILINYQYEL